MGKKVFSGYVSSFVCFRCTAMYPKMSQKNTNQKCFQEPPSLLVKNKQKHKLSSIHCDRNALI